MVRLKIRHTVLNSWLTVLETSGLSRMCASEEIKSDLWEKGQSPGLGKWATVYQKVSSEVKSRELQPTRASIGKTTFPKTQES